jgi:hypothetical protein
VSQFSDRGALRRWRRRNVLASALVLVLAAIVLQSSAAGTSSKPYTATITPTTLVGGTTTSVTFSITNNANPQTLGSVNLTAPSGFSNASYVIASGPGTIDPTSTSTVLKLRNLNLAPSAKVTVTMDTTAPCAGGSYPWSLKVKQSNDFNGPPGNDFSGVAPTTQVTGGCTLDWGNEPASAVKSDTITSAPYDELGDPVTVRAVDPDGNTITSVNGLQVSLGNAATTGCPAATGFSGTSTTMVNGVAEFTGLTSADAAFNCHLVGSATGYQSTPSSGAFNISLAKATCTGSVGCSLPGISLDTDTKVDSSTSNGSFRFLAIGPAEIPSSVTATGAGCANFRPIGGAVFDEADGGGSGTKTFRYYVDKSILPKQFQSSSGQQFLPICAGGTRLGDDGKPLSCLDDTQGGWVDKTLDSSGKMTSIYSTAQCDPGTGLWWGILPSFQDVNPAGIDPGSNPLVTGWGSSTNARYFDISVPSPWDWRAGT